MLPSLPSFLHFTYVTSRTYILSHHACPITHIHIHIHAYAHTSAAKHVYLYTHTHTHTYTHTHTHTHTKYTQSSYLPLALFYSSTSFLQLPITPNTLITLKHRNTQPAKHPTPLPLHLLSLQTGSYSSASRWCEGVRAAVRAS